jgi:hypothetical protein
MECAFPQPLGMRPVSRAIQRCSVGNADHTRFISLNPYFVSSLGSNSGTLPSRAPQFELSVSNKSDKFNRPNC